jgi:hypothetical protein
MPDENNNRRLIDDLRKELTAMQIANVAVLEVIRRDLAISQMQIIAFEKALLDRVQKLEFIPVKIIAYALAGGALTTVLGAVLSKVIIK